MPERTITIHSLDVVEYAYPNLKIRTHVSSGTYIRTLAQDIGKVLGTGAYCNQLRRTAIADWNIEKAQTLAELGITD
jgi:tRNA pseudouridine55 synthase